MPPEHEDARERQDIRARQLAALRRYVAGLGTQQERPAELVVQRTRTQVGIGTPVPEPAGRRLSPRWLVLTGLLVAVALVGGVLVGAVGWSDDRPARGAPGVAGGSAAAPRPRPSAAAPVATPACKTAVDRANAMLASAVRLRGALAEHDRVLNDPANGDLPVRQLLERLSPSIRAGSDESARFDRALAAYRQVVDQCDLRAR
jgi:hypothetical protein